MDKETALYWANLLEDPEFLNSDLVQSGISEFRKLLDSNPPPIEVFISAN